MLRALPIILLFVAGCAATPAKVDPTCFSANRGLADGRDWQREAEQYLGVKCVVFECHGGKGFDSWGREMWYAYPDPPTVPMPVENIAWLLHTEWPHTPIVLVTCNREGYKLHVPGVWYCRKGLVWDRPSWLLDNDQCAGTFDHFVMGEP